MTYKNYSQASPDFYSQVLNLSSDECLHNFDKSKRGQSEATLQASTDPCIQDTSGRSLVGKY